MDYATLLGTMLLLYYTVRHERWNGCYAFFFFSFFFGELMTCEGRTLVYAD